jgi:hypothetical protein
MISKLKSEISEAIFEHKFFIISLILISTVVVIVLLVNHLLDITCDLIYLSYSFEKFIKYFPQLILKIILVLILNLIILTPLILIWIIILKKKHKNKIFIIISIIFIIPYIFIIYIYTAGIVRSISYGKDLCNVRCPVGAMCQNPNF